MALLPPNRVVVTADVNGNLPQAVLDPVEELIEQNTKTLIPDGPITITETAEGVVIGSTATGTGSGIAPQMQPLMTALKAGRSVGIFGTGDSTGAGDQTGADGTDATADRSLLAAVRKIAAAYPGHCALVRSWDPTNEKLGAWVQLQAGSAGRQGFRFTGSRGLWHVPVPAASSLTIGTGVLDVQVLAKPTTITSTNPQTLAARVGAWDEDGSDLLAWASAFSWRFAVTADGRLKMDWSTDGTAWDEQWTSTAALSAASLQWLRGVVTIVPGESITVDFYTSADGKTWTALGTSQSWSGSAVEAIFTPDARAWFEVGVYAKAADPFTGDIYEARILDGKDGRAITPAALHVWRRYGDTSVTVIGSPTIYFVNGSRSSADLAYHQGARIAKEAVDYGTMLAMVNDSHNEGWLSGSSWLSAYTALVDAIQARLPLASMVAVVQNPHTSAWVNEANWGREHVTRLMELTGCAARKGWAMADLFSAFRAADPSLASLILPDGLHPTAAGYQLGGDTIAALAGV